MENIELANFYRDLDKKVLDTKSITIYEETVAWNSGDVKDVETIKCLVDLPRRNETEASEGDDDMDEDMKNKLKLLIVEDDYVSQIIMKKICKVNGWNAVIAPNGNSALEILENDSFDIILMDVQMSGMSGFDVTRQIRENEKLTGRHVTIIATTAYAMSEDMERCLEAGMDDYISKPIDMGKLAAIINKWTQK